MVLRQEKLGLSERPDWFKGNGSVQKYNQYRIQNSKKSKCLYTFLFSSVVATFT